MNHFSVKIVVLTAIGAALYGIGGLPIFGIPLFASTTLKPATAILAIFAGLYGPLVGFLVGFIGHLVTDLFAGWGVWLTWVLGSGIAGIIIGFLPRLTARRLEDGAFPVGDIILFIVLALVGNVGGYSVSALLDFLVYKEPSSKVMIQTALAGGTNTVLIAVVGTAILLLIAKRKKAATGLSEE